MNVLGGLRDEISMNMVVTCTGWDIYAVRGETT